MLNLNMDDFKTEEEIAAQEAEEMQAEFTREYNRTIYCENRDRIIEMVEDIFQVAEQVSENEMAYEYNDNCIKWDINSFDMSQLIIVEGLLAHRMQVGLLNGMSADETGAPVKTLPTNAPFLKGTAFMGNIRDDKQFTDILYKVVKVANIPVEDNDKIGKFVEPVDPNMPQNKCYVMALMGLNDTEMKSLRTASKVKKTADKVNKVTAQLNTVGYAMTKTVVDDIATPAVETVAKLGGAVAGGAINAGFKGASTAINEVLGTVVNADLKNYQPYQEMKSNAKKLAAQMFGGGADKSDSYSFNF